MKTDSTENMLVGSRTTEKHGDGGNVETENNSGRKQKSILVIDTPNDCYDCPLYTSIGYEDGSADEYGFCDDRNILKQEEAQEKIRFDEKPKWCPLNPLPHSKQMENRWFSDDYSKGWNDCLKELEK